MNDKAKSASSRIWEYLSTLSEGAEFTVPMIIEELGVTEGAASGLLHRGCQLGAFRVTGIDQGTRVYVVVDLSLISVRGTASGGGASGRSIDGSSAAKKVATLLRSIADQVEDFHSDLASYSTTELIRELGRRDRASQAKEAQS